MYGFINKYPYTDFHELNLDWVLEQIKKYGDDLKSIIEFLDTLKDEITFIEDLYNQIASGDFPDSVKVAFANWMQENAYDLVGQMVKMVFFGINDAGYFVAYIPESWDDIQFGTSGYDETIEGVDFGHLTLTY